MISKEGRKTSMDPAQEKLRQSKAAWNKSVSAFINDVIHFKKLMNGWPSKYFKERSKITLPIPADAPTIVNSLASQFQDLAQQGAALAQQQAQYSQTRRQKRTDQATQTLNKLDEKYGPTGPEVAAPLAPAPTPTGSELTKQLGAAWEHKYELVSEGSNPFSRFLTKIKTPRIGIGPSAQKRRLRIDLLKISAQTYRSLGKIQVEVSKSSKSSIVTTYRTAQMAYKQWSNVSRQFNNFVNSLPDQLPRPEEMPDHPAPESNLSGSTGKWTEYKFRAETPVDVKAFLQRAKSLGIKITDVKMQQQTILNNGVRVPIPDVVVVFKSDVPLTSIQSILAKVPDGHVMYDTVAWSSAYTGNRPPEQENAPLQQPVSQQVIQEQPPAKKPKAPKVVEPNLTVPPEFRDKKPEEKVASAELEAVAQAFLQKWLGKARHQWLPGNNSGMRLQIFEVATRARKSIDDVMNLLEKDFVTEDLGPKISEVSRQMTALRGLVMSLYNIEKPMAKGQPGSEDGWF
jgi:hypothetical protein